MESTVLLDTRDLDEAEIALSANYSKIRINATTDSAPTSIRIERSLFGSIGIDAIDYGCGFSYEMDPPESIVISGVVSGALQASHQRQATFCWPGEVYVFGAQDGKGYRGQVRAGHYRNLVVERSILDRVAVPWGEPVQLTGSTPVSAAANRYLFDCIEYLRRAAAGDADQNPLIRGGVEQYLAALLLGSFPSTASPEPASAELRGGTPQLLRRAMGFIEENARADISLADIAATVHVTPRTLQYAFRKHRDCTPTEYLRLVRLHHAHRDLLTANGTVATVGEIAHRWGFAHLGRFAGYYSDEFGQSPQVTLRIGRVPLTG
ncbi:helix-turn-helix transcriptional regulator [Mycobacterium vicinigordonae]|uniref:Helix-turn-helix transcriptional regulator n=1 Tax=Mycobacterium vicinigordonae TaxID=1719132 RepID=A0A7D6IRW6_9MYCO|nr:helix-turn-helix transcriptional regulator [Mycobacterium vicinigordonae]